VTPLNFDASIDAEFGYVINLGDKCLLSPRCIRPPWSSYRAVAADRAPDSVARDTPTPPQPPPSARVAVSAPCTEQPMLGVFEERNLRIYVGYVLQKCGQTTGWVQPIVATLLI